MVRSMNQLSLTMNGRVTVLAGSLTALALLAPTEACLVDRTPTPSGDDTGGASGRAGSGGASQGGSKGGGTAGTGAGGKPGAGGAGGSPGSGGTSATGGTSGSGGSSSQYANFATVSEIVQAKCGGSGCHDGDTPPTMLGISDAKLYTLLTAYVSTYCGNRVLVKPGSPDQSAFYLAQEGQCGNTLPQMPLGCVDTCTPSDYLDGVRQWIANGAPQ
jgi:hypothetical protein